MSIKTTIKTELCSFSEQRIYPGRGQRFVARDGKVHVFIHSKQAKLFRQKIKPVKLHWTLLWRRMNKKGAKDYLAKRKSRKSQKTVQKAIVGLPLEDIMRKRGAKPEAKKVAKVEASKKEDKEKTKKTKNTFRHASANMAPVKRDMKMSASKGRK